MSPPVTKDALMRAILSLDVYHRGYNQGVRDDASAPNLGVTAPQVGQWTLLEDSLEFLMIDGKPAHEVGFFAQAYTNGERIIISYRGTDDGFMSASNVDPDTRFVVHSNVGWNLDRFEKFFVTPRFHHWHHGIEKEAIDVNFAIHFPVYDWLFGTYYMPEKKWPAGYGIKGHPVPNGYVAQFLHPFNWLKARRAEAKVEPAE